MMMKATTTASALRSSNNHVHGSFSPGGNHALGNGEKDRVTRELDAMQTEVELWYRRTGHDITSTHHHLSSLIQSSIDTLQGILFPGSNTKNGLPGSNVVHIPTSNHGLSSDGRGFHSSSLNNNNGTPLRSSSSNNNNNNHHHHHQVLAPQANFPPSQVGNTHLHHAPHNGHVMDTETTTQPTASTPYMERRPFHGSSTSSASNSVPDTHSSYNTLLSEGGNDSDAAYLFRGMKSGHTASPHLTSMALNDGKFALQATAQPFVPGSTGGSSPPMQHGSNPNLPTAYRSTPNERGNNIVAQIMARGSAGSTGSGEIDPLDSSNSSAASSTRGLLITHGPGGRPLVQRGVHPSHLEEATRHIVPHLPCQVLVEFKRKRILQFECEQYVPPGEYVVVGGDRGEDVGLVIYTWQETPSGSSNGYGVDGAHLNKWVCVGLGKVIRIANPLEVSQLHGVQSELERRAVEVAEQKVLEHSLNMRVVDAEYQFDRKKLTFYYEAQSRLDFRDLVRDLYKAFRARIWMEMVETHGNSNSSLSASLPHPQTPTLQGSNNTRTEGSETSSFGGAFSSSGNGRGGNGFVNNSYYEPNGDGTKGFGWGPEDDDEVFPAGGGPHEHSEGELGNLDALHHVMLTPPLMRSHGTPTQVVSQRSYQTRMNHSNVQAHLSHKMNDQNQNVGDDDHIHSSDASNNAYPIKKEEGLNDVTSHYHSTPHGIENTGANESSPDSAVETSAARNAVAQCMYED